MHFSNTLISFLYIHEHTQHMAQDVYGNRSHTYIQLMHNTINSNAVQLHTFIRSSQIVLHSQLVMKLLTNITQHIISICVCLVLHVCHDLTEGLVNAEDAGNYSTQARTLLDSLKRRTKKRNKKTTQTQARRAQPCVMIYYSGAAPSHA